MSVIRTRRKAEKKPMIFWMRIINRCVGVGIEMVNWEVESSFMNLRQCDVMTPGPRTLAYVVVRFFP